MDYTITKLLIKKGMLTNNINPAQGRYFFFFNKEKKVTSPVPVMKSTGQPQWYGHGLVILCR